MRSNKSERRVNLALCFLHSRSGEVNCISGSNLFSFGCASEMRFCATPFPPFLARFGAAVLKPS